MEQDYQQTIEPKRKYKFEFWGTGMEYFEILIINWVLTLITLGMYYPWAKANRLRYMYGNTMLDDQRFHFSGTGKEMFKGFIKLILIYIGIMVVYFSLIYFIKSPILALLFLYMAILAIIPFAIHGSMRYRMSRTSYRGIRFGYRGDRGEFTKKFYLDLFLTIITLGIYGSWFQMNLLRYTHEHVRYGDVEFSNDSNGGDWFVLNLKGYILTVLTLGIYSFWWHSERFEYYINNISAYKGDQKLRCRSTATGGDFFGLLVVNFLIVVFTLGFGKAWADVRTQKFICEHVEINGNINLAEITQTEEEYINAFGEDTLDFFDIDIA